MKKKLVKKIYKNKKEEVNLLVATCLGKQFEVWKGHGQVGPCRGGANQFPWGGQLIKKDIDSHFYLDFTYNKLFCKISLLLNRPIKLYSQPWKHAALFLIIIMPAFMELSLSRLNFKLRPSWTMNARYLLHHYHLTIAWWGDFF